MSGFESFRIAKHLNVKPEKARFIPEVCREMGIPCFNLLGMMRRENWVF